MDEVLYTTYKFKNIYKDIIEIYILEIKENLNKSNSFATYTVYKGIIMPIISSRRFLKSFNDFKHSM